MEDGQGRRARLRGIALAAVPASLVALAIAPAPARATVPHLCTEALVPMSDGVRLHAWVSQPETERPRPVLFMMDSYARTGEAGGTAPNYDNGCPTSLPDNYVDSFISERVTDHFNLVQVSYRGTGSSEGTFDFTGPRTQQDIREAIRWAATGPWSNGDVTLIGESGTAFFAHHALGNPHVRAAVIFSSCADMYRCIYRGGAYNGLAEIYLAGTIGGYLSGSFARARMGTTGNPGTLGRLAALAGAIVRPKLDAVNGPWWQRRSALGKLPDSTAPVMYTTDLYDIVQPFDALQLTPGARVNLAMGHTSLGAIKAGGERYLRLVRRPVDRFVMRYGAGRPNGAERDPRVTLATNTGGVSQFNGGRLLIRGERRWPLPGTRWTRLFLDPRRSGSAESLNDGSLGLRPPAGAPGPTLAPLLTTGGLDPRFAGFLLGDSLPGDLRERERLGLTYTTPPLERDLEVSGPISLRVFASTRARDFDWSVRVADVAPDGRSRWITGGFLRASLREVDPELSLRNRAGEIVRPWHTYRRPRPVPPGAPVPYLIDVIGTSNVFRAGHRIRLDILPVNSGQLDSLRTGGVGTLGVWSDASHPSSISLPVIPDRCGRSVPLAPGTPVPEGCASSYRGAIGAADRAGAVRR